MLLRFFIFCGLFLGIHFMAVAQAADHLIDSLENVLRQQPDLDSTRVALLLTRADQLCYADPQQAMKMADSAVAISSQHQLKMSLAKSYRQKGVIYYVLSDYINALEYSHQAIKLAGSDNALFNAIVFNNIATVYADMGRSAEALSYFQQFLDVSRKVGFRAGEIQALNNCGTIFIETNQLDSALVYFAQCRNLSKDFDQLYYGLALNNTGIIYKHKQDYPNAIRFFKESAGIGEKTGQAVSANAQLGLGQVYLLMGQYPAAETALKQSLALSKEMELIQGQANAYEALSNLYDQQGKAALAFDQYKQYIGLRDSVLNDQKKSELVRKELVFKNEMSEALLKAGYDAKIRQQRQARNYWLALAALLLLSAGILFFFYKKRKTAELKKNEAELEAQKMETDMRVMRLQMNPHFIFNSLNSISDYMHQKSPEEATEYLAKFARVMRMTLENTEQRSVVLEDDLAMLALYMDLEKKRLRDKFSYEIRVAKDIDAQSLLVPPMIFQPFVENCIWHGIAAKEEKGHILIAVEQQNGMLKVRIEDNGIGRLAAGKNKAAQGKQSLGMKITKARIDLINRLNGSSASVQLIDLPNATGTEALVNLPLEPRF